MEPIFLNVLIIGRFTGDDTTSLEKVVSQIQEKIEGDGVPVSFGQPGPDVGEMTRCWTNENGIMAEIKIEEGAAEVLKDPDCRVNVLWEPGKGRLLVEAASVFPRSMSMGCTFSGEEGGEIS